jgi:hypothetical protein
MSAPKLTETYNVKLLTAGWSPRTNRFYPKEALRLVQSQFTTPSIGDFMFSGDATGLRLDLANASHRTNRLYLKNADTELWAEVQILDTRCGRLVRDLHKKGNVRFDCAMTGVVNRFDEVVPDTVQFIRVTAFGVY